MNRKNLTTRASAHRLFTWLIATCAATALAGETSATSASDLGFSPERLARLDTLAQTAIDEGVVAGETLLLADFVRTLAEQPLAHHPGEAWTYGLSTDVLGRLIEVISGQTLDRFMAERIFTPLRMEDTYFEVPTAKRDRVVAVHRRSEGGSLQPIPDGRVEDGLTVYDVAYPYDGQTGYLCGGAGLTSTAGDYARFLQMLLNGGELDGQRLLGRKTVQLMTSNQVSHLEESAFGAAGFTLGFALGHGPENGQIQSANSLRWGGFWNTDFWFDPQENLVGILMTQHYPYGHRLMDTYKVAIYQALVD